MPGYGEADVRDVLSVQAVLDALELTLVRAAEGTATNIAKTMTTWQPRSSAHALGAFDSVDGLVGFKTWVNTPAGATAQLTLFDASNGKLLAFMAAGHLGLFRTAAISGLATRCLSAGDADELAIIGTGRQALAQVEAVNLVRPLTHIRVWSPSPERRAAFGAEVAENFGVDVTVAASVEEAVNDAAIVTVITRASEPFLARGMLSPNAHLNAVGAILPMNAEFDAELLADARITVVDSPENAKQASRELREFFGDDWSAVHPLGDVLTGKVAVPPEPGLTVFKALGMGLCDLAAAAAFLRIVQPDDLRPADEVFAVIPPGSAALSTR